MKCWVDEKVRIIRYIQEYGTKRLAKNGRQEGYFVIAEEHEWLAQGKPISYNHRRLQNEGNISKDINVPVVAAFGSENPMVIAKALHDKLPSKAIVITGDDDRHLFAIFAS